MQELKSVLTECKLATIVNFNPLNHCIQCYAHIINICSSHIISSMTSTSTSYLTQLKVPSDSNYTMHGDSDNESDDGDDPHHGVDELDLELGLYSDLYNDLGASKYELWVAGIKCDPLRHAWKLICILCASDE